MDLIIEVFANAAFIIGIFFGPAIVVDVYNRIKA